MHQEENAHALEKQIASLLNWGVRASFILILTGLIAALVGGSGDLRVIESPVRPPGAPGFLRDVALDRLAFTPATLVTLGLVALVLTPFARVLFALGTFVKRRDWVYALLAALVLGMLILGFLVGSAP